MQQHKSVLIMQRSPPRLTNSGGTDIVGDHAFVLLLHTLLSLVHPEKPMQTFWTQCRQEKTKLKLRRVPFLIILMYATRDGDASVT